MPSDRARLMWARVPRSSTMIRRLLVASLGIAMVFGLVGMGQAQKARSKKAQPRDSQSTSGSAAEAEKPADAEQAKDKGGESGAEKSDASKDKARKVAKLEKATFGGGCFWCTEAVFERIPGVKAVVSGYSG